MIKYQKVIKYLAIAFAIVLIINIFSWFVFGLSLFRNILGLEKNSSLYGSMDNLKKLEVFDYVSSLKIDVKTIDLVFKIGDKFNVETNSENIQVSNKKNQIVIKEKEYKWFNNHDQKNLVVTVPRDFVFDDIEIDTDAGKVQVESLTTKDLSLNLGTGRVVIDLLYVINETEIDSGVGEVTISDGAIHNLNMDMGVGKVSVTSLITGKSEIDSGIGEVYLYLLGEIKDYQIKVNKGIGAITIDDEEMKDASVYGTGENYIHLDGGIGKITVNF